MNPVPYGRQDITEEDIHAVVETLRSDFLTQGPKIAEFENDFAQYTGAKYAVAVSNGTAALHLSAMALNIQPGDNVIVTPMTFAASANCVRYCGGNVVFCDIDRDTYLLDLEKLKQTLVSKPKGYYKGIIPVDFAGYPVHGEKLRKIADEYGLWIIEDACHAPGAWFTDSEGEKQLTGNGNFAELTCFSFHPVKHIATGEGGMITTNSKALYEKLILYRTHGITKNPDLLNENHGGWYYEMLELGYNYRLTDFQAALGISQLKRANDGLVRRQEIARRYDEAFKDVSGIITPKVSPDVYHAYHLYIIQTEERRNLYDYLKENDIHAQVHYEPVHLQPYYKKLGNKLGDMPVAENFYRHCLSLPMYPALTDEEQEYVIEKVRGFALTKQDRSRPKISIIVPVYNVEKYLRQCLDSLIHQTLKEIEIICVNDASPDNSLNILNEYAQKDGRIIVINLKENRKQGGARNAGIQMATAQYITLVDSDDWCATDFCENLWNGSENGSVDLVCSDFYQIENDKVTVCERFPSHILELTKSERDKYFILYGWFGWPSMLKRTLFFDYQLFSPENRFGEDVALSSQAFCIANKIVQVKKPLYYYRIRENSTTHTAKQFPVKDYMLGAISFFEDMKRLGFYDIYKTVVEARFYREFYRQSLLRCIFRFSKPQVQCINQIKQQFKKDYGFTKKSYYMHYKYTLSKIRERQRNILLQTIQWNTMAGIFLIRLLWLCKGKLR